MGLDRDELAARVLCALVTKDGVNGYGSASDAVRAADDLLLALKPAEVAPVAAGNMGRVTEGTRLLDGSYFGPPNFLDPAGSPAPAECEDCGFPATPPACVHCHSVVPVPPPATTPVPEVLTPDVPEGSTIAQLAAEQRASMGLTASMGSTQHFTHAATPAPEAKRPTLADVERSAEAFAHHKGDIPHSPSDAWMDGWLARDRAVAHDGIAHSTNAPCPPPVAGSVGCDKEYAELVRAARLTVERVERLGSVSSVEALRGALKDLDNAISRPVRP